jgi:hypothetical protein
MTQDPLTEIKQRTARYWYVDGLWEACGGVLVLLLAGYTYLVGLCTIQPLRSFLIGLGQPVLLIAGMVVLGKIVSLLKERLTYPLTGYISYRRPKGLHRWVGVLAMLVAVGVAMAAVIFLRTFPVEDWVMTITGAFSSILILMMGIRIRLWRFYFLAGTTFLAGLGASLLRFSDPFGVAFFLGVFGLTCLLMGLLTLRSYRRQALSSRPSSEEEV